MNRNKNTQPAKVLKKLSTGNNITRSELTKAGIRNPAAVIANLREQGYAIYTNKNGYRLGKPSRRMVSIAYRVAGAEFGLFE